MTTEVVAKRFSVEQFQRMAELGVFEEDDRLELLDGVILQMNPVGRRHVAVVNRLTRVFARVIGERAMISVQNPLVLGPASEPQPDIALLRPRADDYEGALPTGKDALLVVEVADTTLDYDTRRKAAAYARGSVPAVWVVALAGTAEGDHVLVFTDPDNRTYTRRSDARRGDRLSIPGLPDVLISVSDFLA